MVLPSYGHEHTPVEQRPKLHTPGPCHWREPRGASKGLRLGASAVPGGASSSPYHTISQLSHQQALQSATRSVVECTVLRAPQSQIFRCGASSSVDGLAWLLPAALQAFQRE